MHLRVQVLDRYFGNVCELDLIFHADKVHHILDEIVMGGMVLETNMHDILTAINDMAKLETISPARQNKGQQRR